MAPIHLSYVLEEYIILNNVTLLIKLPDAHVLMIAAVIYDNLFHTF